jgi:hypothetical protein
MTNALTDLLKAWDGPARHGYATGAEFMLHVPSDPPALWGIGSKVAWARGEGLLIYAPQGVGKTTIMQQLLLRRVGIGEPEFLGLPVVPTKSVLYLALDRPPQIARSFRRMVNGDDAEVLARTFVVWQGPLPFKLGGESIVNFAADLGIEPGSTIAVDSYKNLSANLSDEETGALIDTEMQHVLSAGYDWVGAHHPRKATGDNKRPNTLDDVYGSTWLTAGVGSVVGLWGKAGDESVELIHLKQPAEPIGPMLVQHDHARGVSTSLDFAPGSSASSATKSGTRRQKILGQFMAAPSGTELTIAAFDRSASGLECSDDSLRRDLVALTEEGLLESLGESTRDRRWRFVPPLASEA